MKSNEAARVPGRLVFWGAPSRGTARTGLLVSLFLGTFLCAALAGATAYFLRSELREARVNQGEREAVRLLVTIAAAEDRFRDEARMDADGDGRGEYGFLQELADVAWRHGARSAARSGPLLPAEIGWSVAREGVGIRRGYCFLVYLPGPAVAIPESHPLPESGPSGRTADRQEEHWVAYAWPLEHGVSGRRAFAVSEERTVLVTPNVEDPYQGPRARVPEAASAFDSLGPDAANLGSGLAGLTGGRPVDGRTWSRVEHE
ncbi:MAG: hypothetical protein HY720_19775 [Planctomycetes bacterium]|nr:hypothetical protein [Planctomycetota bacterium]